MISKLEAIAWLGARVATSSLSDIDPDTTSTFAECMISLGADPDEVIQACLVGLREPD